jgi:hypothetical protein
MRLGTAYNFVINCSDSELESYIDLNAEQVPSIPISTFGDLAWCLQAYSILKKRENIPVICTNQILDHTINIVHSNRLPRLQLGQAGFIVCVQGDFPRRRLAHYHLVQNQRQVFTDTSYIPHWIQPGLLGREPGRTGVKNVAYTGQTFNGNFAAPAEQFEAFFSPHGINFSAVPPELWYDLRAVDVLVAIRSFDTHPHNNKPPSKLFNAWHAGIPFVGGYDSAYMQVGTPGEDYLLAKTPGEVTEAVLQLVKNDHLYSKLVENGRKKAALYSNEKIAGTWEAVLSGPVLQRYHSWKVHPNFEQLRFSTLLQLGRLEQQSKTLLRKMRRPAHA